MLSFTVLWGCKQENQHVAPPLKVSVAPPMRETITRYLETTGSVQAVNTVDLMARVQGFLQEIGYRDGAYVHKGDILFTIEPLPYQAKLQQTQAAEKGAQAQLMQASAEHERQARLGREDFASQASVDDARAKRDSTQSSLDQARGDMQIAAINYTYTRVMAPFDGFATAHLVSAGELGELHAQRAGRAAHPREPRRAPPARGGPAQRSGRGRAAD